MVFDGPGRLASQSEECEVRFLAFALSRNLCPDSGRSVSDDPDSMSLGEESLPDLCDTHLERGEDWRSFNRHLRARSAHDASPMHTLLAREVRLHDRVCARPLRRGLGAV